jgi:uncharacterized protein (AIM24 family)
MQDFEIETLENIRYVRAVLRDEAIRTEAGALSHMRGAISMSTPIPGPLSLMRASLSAEAAVRPIFRGTGDVYLEATLGGYYALQVNEKPWILDRGAYWASEASVSLQVHREKIMNAYWTGAGFIEFHTRVSGKGKVVLNTPGPVEEIDLGDEELAVEGHAVIARSSRVHFSVRRPSRGRLSSWLSGEKLLRVYRGPGRILLASTPYWSELLLKTAREGRK